MKKIRIGSLFLFLAVILFTVFVGGKKINSSIEETIKNNYQTEIEVLKDRLNKQSELINSIININNKNEQTNNSDEDSITTSKPTVENNPIEDSNTQVEFEYIKENGGITITKYVGKKTSLQIPNEIEQLPVLKIAENAFADTKIKSIILPSGCIEIDWFAFYGCYALNSIYIPAGVETIGYGAFDACSKTLTIYCEKNSYAQKYAQSFGIAYSYY